MACKLTKKEDGYSKYKCEKSNVVRLRCEVKSQKYPLSVNEVNEVLKAYDAKEKLKSVVIDDCEMGRLQGRVLRNTRSGDKHLELYAPSELALHLRKSNLKDSALFTLMHEISHLKGEYDEGRADDFAEAEFQNAKEILKM